MLIEVCCGSVDDALRAQKGGAARIELNSALFLGGLTPSIGTLELARQVLDISIIAMIRPRSGGFCYSESEFAAMKRDAKALIEAGADGIIFGILCPDGTLDYNRNAELAELGQSLGAEVAFHRAIDVVPNWKEALEQLIDMGIQRVLTTGQKPRIEEGAATVKAMVELAGSRIEILPGGLAPHNIGQLSEYMGTTQAHIASFETFGDSSCQNNRQIFFGGALYPTEQHYEVIDPDFVRACQTPFQQ